MGILESCEGHDPRMSVSLDMRLFRDSNQAKYTGDDFYFKKSKLKLFGDIFYKKVQGKTEFVLQTLFVNRNADVINHSIKIYEDSASFIHEKGSKIKIVGSIDDPNIIDAHLYIVKVGNKPDEQLMKLIPFNRYE